MCWGRSGHEGYASQLSAYEANEEGIFCNMPRLAAVCRDEYKRQVLILLLGPKLTVEQTILNCLTEMLSLNCFFCIKVCNCAGNTKNFVVGTSREAKV